MSHQDDKDKHSKRLHKDYAAVQRQMNLLKAFDGVEYDTEPHRFAKHHAHENHVEPIDHPHRDLTKQEKSFIQTQLWED